MTAQRRILTLDQSSVSTTCAYCGVGCGVLMRRDSDNGRWTASGDDRHPANHGRLCVKGSALGDTLTLKRRLLEPQVDGSTTDWHTALQASADRLGSIIREHGPDAVAFYVSGQLLTEDYYVANKLMKGFIGSANIDTNSRLCMSTAVAAHNRVLGSDTVPGCYEDLEQADLLVITGSNMAWTHPVVYQRIVAAKAARPEMSVVVIDPRRTATCDLADIHLAIQPGMDGFLFDGLLAWLAESNALDSDYIASYTEGAEEALAASRGRYEGLHTLAKRVGVSPQELRRFFELFAKTDRTVTVFSQGINQSSSGVDKAAAILHCHLATGRIGKPGATPFSITGQPNAMGGREVGGLANQLAAHLSLGDASHRALVQRFWQSPTVASHPGRKAVDLFDAIHDGRVKAVWIMATNPVVSLPNADHVREALKKAECVIVSDCVDHTDTLDLAHIKLPAAGWGEKDGTVTNSERRISRQRAFLPLPGEARPDWWIISEVAKRLGFADAFDYSNSADIFREHAALSGFENSGTRDFDISALATLTDEQYQHLVPVQWPVSKTHTSGVSRMYADGHFFTPSGRARFVDTTPKAPARQIDAQHPWCLSTGRIRDQWHTMTRTGRAARLLTHIDEPFLAMHPEDIRANGWRVGQPVSISSPSGQCVLPLISDDGQQRGNVFAPIHWNDQFSGAARIDAVVPALVDPLSGQPEYKQVPVQVSGLAVSWHLYALSTQPAVPEESSYWCRIPGEQLTRLHAVGDSAMDLSRLQAAYSNQAEQWAELIDPLSGQQRLVGFINGKPSVWLALSTEPVNADWAWLEQVLSGQEAGTALALAYGKPLSGGDTSDIICSCHRVRKNAIEETIAAGAKSVDAIGHACRAGTNCGSCIPELRQILADSRTSESPQEEASPCDATT